MGKTGQFQAIDAILLVLYGNSGQMCEPANLTVKITSCIQHCLIKVFEFYPN